MRKLLILCMLLFVCCSVDAYATEDVDDSFYLLGPTTSYTHNMRWGTINEYSNGNGNFVCEIHSSSSESLDFVRSGFDFNNLRDMKTGKDIYWKFISVKNMVVEPCDDCFGVLVVDLVDLLTDNNLCVTENTIMSFCFNVASSDLWNDYGCEGNVSMSVVLNDVVFDVRDFNYKSFFVGINKIDDNGDPVYGSEFELWYLTDNPPKGIGHSYFYELVDTFTCTDDISSFVFGGLGKSPGMAYGDYGDEFDENGIPNLIKSYDFAYFKIVETKTPEGYEPCDDIYIKVTSYDRFKTFTGLEFESVGSYGGAPGITDVRELDYVVDAEVPNYTVDPESRTIMFDIVNKKIKGVSVDKKIDGRDYGFLRELDVAMGKNMPYMTAAIHRNVITIDMPSNISSYNSYVLSITDEMSSGLIVDGSVDMYLHGYDVDENLVRQYVRPSYADYVKSTGVNGECIITYDSFDVVKVFADVGVPLDERSYIEIRYYTKLGDGVITETDKLNKVVVKTPDDEVEDVTPIFSVKLNVSKTDDLGNELVGSGWYLENFHFDDVLSRYNSLKGEYSDIKNDDFLGEYVPFDGKPALPFGTNWGVKYDTSSFKFRNVGVGYFRLYESVVPNNYIGIDDFYFKIESVVELIDNEWTLVDLRVVGEKAGFDDTDLKYNQVMTQEEYESRLSFEQVDIPYDYTVDLDTRTISFVIPNEPIDKTLPEMPATGGSGIMGVILLGCVLISIGSFVMKRKETV